MLQQLGCDKWKMLPNTSAECTTMAVPLQEGSERTIEFFVKRILAQVQPAIGEVWLLNGGPGESGVLMECMVGKLQDLTYGSLNFVIPDHRGTGRSSPLLCGNESSVTKECVGRLISEHSLDYLHAFSTSNAARDIKLAMELSGSAARRSSGYRVMLHGASYGTYLAQRFLQLFPDAVDAVVLDGVCAPDLTRLYIYALSTNAAGSALVEQCNTDASCRAFAGAHPLFNVQLVFQLLMAGRLECNNQLAKAVTAEQLRTVFGMLVQDAQLRLLILPVVRRMLRCNERDVAALDTLFSVTAQPPSLSVPILSNDLLMFNIGYSELWDYQHSPLTATQLRDMQLGLYFSSNSGGEQIMEAAAAPAFSPYNDSLTNSYPDTRVNLLMVQGALDPQTPPEWAEHAKNKAYSGANQHLVRVPYAVHVSATLPNRSPMVGSGGDCGIQVVASFFGSGGLQKPDVACIGKLAPPDFAGFEQETKLASKAFLGTEDMWGEEGAVQKTFPQEMGALLV